MSPLKKMSKWLGTFSLFKMSFSKIVLWEFMAFGYFVWPFWHNHKLDLEWCYPFKKQKRSASRFPLSVKWCANLEKLGLINKNTWFRVFFELCDHQKRHAERIAIFLNMVSQNTSSQNWWWPVFIFGKTCHIATDPIKIL